MIVNPESMVTMGTLVQDKIELENLRLSLDAVLPGNETLLRETVAQRLGVNVNEITQARITQKRIVLDSKEDVHVRASVSVSLASDSLELSLFSEAHTQSPAFSRKTDSRLEAIQPEIIHDSTLKSVVAKNRLTVMVIPDAFMRTPKREVVVYGAGLPVLFAALYLAKSGLKPTVCWAEGSEDPLSCTGIFAYGQGHPLEQTIIGWLLELGAPQSIDIDQYPYFDRAAYEAVRAGAFEEIERFGGRVLRNCTSLDVDCTAEGVQNVTVALGEAGLADACGEGRSSDAQNATFTAPRLLVSQAVLDANVQEKLRAAGVAFEETPCFEALPAQKTLDETRAEHFGAFANHAALENQHVYKDITLEDGRPAFLLDDTVYTRALTSDGGAATKPQPVRNPASMSVLPALYVCREGEPKDLFASVIDGVIAARALITQACEYQPADSYEERFPAVVASEAVVASLADPQPGKFMGRDFSGGPGGGFASQSQVTNPTQWPAFKNADETPEVGATSVAAKQPELEERTFVDTYGNQFTYAVLPDSTVYLYTCKPATDVLHMPLLIEGHVVTEMGKRIFHESHHITELTLPPALRTIGFNALAALRELRILRLPAGMTSLDVRALAALNSLEELYLPDMLEKIPANLLTMCSPKLLYVGTNTRAVGDGAFTSTALERVEVDARNPWLKTDGLALYDRAGACLLALATNVSHYDVMEGCKVIGRKAFAVHESLTSIYVPDSLQELSEFCFFRGRLERFDAPAGLQTIGTRAFAQCGHLSHVTLNEGLRFIGEEVFMATAITELHLPSTVAFLGNHFCDASRLVDGVKVPLVSVSPENKTFFMDEDKALYARGEQGLIFWELLDADINEYCVLPGTVELWQKSFANKSKLVIVELPTSLKTIGKAAFRTCEKLRCIEGCENLESIQEGAFNVTALEQLHIPASFHNCQDDLLVTCDRGSRMPAETVNAITISPDNKLFFMENDFVCHRRNDGLVEAMLFMGEATTAVIPRSVSVIGAYCFSHASNVEAVEMHDGIVRVERGWVRTKSPMEKVVYHCPNKPVAGKTSFTFYFPVHRTGHDDIRRAFESGDINLKNVFDRSDEAMYWARDRYLRAYNAIGRLHDPLMLSDINRNKLDQLMRSHLTEAVSEFIKHGYVTGLDQMRDLGMITESNILEFVEIANELGSTDVTSFLMEMRRKHFEYNVMSDYDI